MPGASIAAVCASVGFIYRWHGSVFAKILAPMNDLLYWDRKSRDVPARRVLYVWIRSVISKLFVCREPS